MSHGLVQVFLLTGYDADLCALTKEMGCAGKADTLACASN